MPIDRHYLKSETSEAIEHHDNANVKNDDIDHEMYLTTLYAN